MNPVYQDLSRFIIPQDFRGRSKVYIQLWWAVQATFFRMFPQFLYEWRNFLLRLFGAKIGRGVKIRPTSKITYPWNLMVGDHSWIGDDCTIYNLAKIEIGNNVALAHKVYLCTGMHDHSDRSFKIFAEEIVIKDEVWLANDVFIGPGVTIGRGTVVGVRSTVLKNLPEGMICYGHPAKPIKPRIIITK